MTHDFSDVEIESPDALRHNLKAASPIPATADGIERSEDEKPESKSSKKSKKRKNKRKHQALLANGVKEERGINGDGAVKSASAGTKIKLEPSSDGTVDGSP